MVVWVLLRGGKRVNIESSFYSDVASVETESALFLSLKSLKFTLPRLFFASSKNS